MTEGLPDIEIGQVLRLAFGADVPAIAVPVAPGQSERGSAYVLDGAGVPPRVVLLRYFPREQAHAFRAFTAMRELKNLNFPVPDVYYLGWSGHTHTMLMLIQDFDGRRAAGEPYPFFARVGEHFAQVLAHLHGLPWDALPDLPLLPFHYTLHELAQLVRRLETWELQQILAWLLARADALSELPRTVIHGDYTLQHVVADPPRVIAVSGWEHAAIADPRFDVGYASTVLGAYGVELSNQFLDAYQSVAGPVPDSAFWEVFSALRLLARVARTLATLRAPQRERFLALAGPAWRGLLRFVQARTGLELY